MNFDKQEISYLTLACETLMEQLNDEYQDDRDLEVRRKYYKLWDLRNKLNK
jgi:hypothetical protein